MSGRSFWQAVVNMTQSAQPYHTAQSITEPYEGNALELTIFVPCCNHAATIAPTLETALESMRLVEKKYEIIVIDDGSKDGSVEAVREFITQHQDANIVLVVNKKPAGRVENYLSAAFMGCGKYFVEVPADNRDLAKNLADIFKAVGDADIIVPYCLPEMNEGASQMQVGLMTRLLNFLTRNRLNYYNGQAVHLRYNAMRWQLSVRGSAYPTALLCRLLELGFTYKQVPVRMREQPYPVTWGDCASLLHALLALMARRLLHLLRQHG